MNKPKLIAIGIIFIVVILPIIIWLSASINDNGSVKVPVYVVPNDASVSIEDKKIKGKSSTQLNPGRYTVIISKDGFISQTKEIIVDEGVIVSIAAALQPSSKEATEWYNKNQSRYIEFEGKIGQQEAEKGVIFTEKNPITKWLPLQKAIYTIGYKQDNSSDNPYAIIITIRAVRGFREAAIQEIRNNDHNPGDYKIEFIDYRNPFDE